MATSAQAGIYCLKINEYRYWGSSNDLARRLRNHEWSLRSGRHPNRWLQRVYDKYGGDFEWTIEETCSVPELEAREQTYLDMHFGTSYCLNLSPTAGNLSGIQKTPLTRHRMRLAARNRPPRDPEVIARIGAKNRGRKRSDEFKKQVSDRQRGRRKSDAERQSIHNAQLVRIPSDVWDWLSQASAAPRQSSPDAAERHAYKWLNMQRRASSFRHAWLDENLPHWRSWTADAEGRGSSMHLRFASWYGLTADEQDRHVESARVVAWVQRRVRNGASDSWLDQHCPDWRLMASRADRLWLASAREWLVAEAHDTDWLRRTRRNKSPHRQLWLDEHFPGWRTVSRGDLVLPEWLSTARAVIDWSNLHEGRHPRLQAVDPEERRLGAWLVNQRFAASDLRRGWLDSHFPGWMQSNNARAKPHPSLTSSE